MDATTPTSPPDVTLLFDGECPICRAEIRFLRSRDDAGRLGFVDITSSDFDPARHGLTRDAVHARLHAVLRDGRVIDGVEVFRRAYDAVGLGWILAPTRWPLLSRLTDRAYDVFARHRVRLGRVFGRPACDAERCTPR